MTMREMSLPSSSLSPAPSANPQIPTTVSQQISSWRPTRELPFEIQQYVRNYIEEALFTRALDILLSIVSADASSPQNRITVPLPQHLALAGTLVVHPLSTTRTTSEEKWADANSALRLLRILLKTTGPVNPTFRDAFKFRKLYDTTDDGEVDDGIRHPFANEDNIWNRGDDIWSVIGWAFNCSCLPDMYAARWEHWLSWLEFMIDVLEADWRYHQLNSGPFDSLLWKYLSQTPGQQVYPRRVVRAIFADGSKSSLNEFREVFRHELRGPKQNSTDNKMREAVDIDNEIFGDYLAQDESDDSSENERSTSKRISTRTPSSRRITPRTSRASLRSDLDDDAPDSPSPHSSLGPPDSITLRLRLMQLLVSCSHATNSSPSRTGRFPNPSELYTLLVEFTKPLPLPSFRQLTSPAIINTTTVTSENLNILLQFLLERLLETTSSKFAEVEVLTQHDLEAEYLPLAANKASVDANARVSLCLEGLLRVTAAEGKLVKSDSLVNSVEVGIARRLEKVKGRRERSKVDEAEDEAWLLLSESSARMKAVVKRLKS